MLRKHESTHSWKAAALALAVHAALLGAMLVSIDWKAAHPVLNVTEVELWDKLPSEKSSLKINPKIEKPVVNLEPIEQPKLEPKPEPKVEITREDVKVDDPKVDIILEKKKKEPEPKIIKPELEKDNLQKKDNLTNEQVKLAQLMREEDLQEKINDKREKQVNIDALKKLQENLLNEEGESKAEAKAASAANAGIIGEFKAKIQAKIRGNVNKTLCEDINAEPKFNIALLPTGELSGTPKLIKTSGNEACDEAVERAIHASQPLPLPSDASLFSSFKNLNLTFKPND